MIIIIPGWLIALVTFPGVIIHEIAHKFFCDLTKTKVYKVAYFIPLEKTAGYVIHEGAHNALSSFLIAVAPFFINSVVCIMLTLPYGIDFLMPISHHEMSVFAAIAKSFITWVGFSAGLHAMPSNKDLDSVQESQHFLLDLVISSSSAVLRIFNIEIFGTFLQLGYAILIYLMIPLILLH